MPHNIGAFERPCRGRGNGHPRMGCALPGTGACSRRGGAGNGSRGCGDSAGDGPQGWATAPGTALGAVATAPGTQCRRVGDASKRHLLLEPRCREPVPDAWRAVSRAGA
jgi:hypothetical protein